MKNHTTFVIGNGTAAIVVCQRPGLDTEIVIFIKNGDGEDHAKVTIAADVNGEAQASITSETLKLLTGPENQPVAESVT